MNEVAIALEAISTRDPAAFENEIAPVPAATPPLMTIAGLTFTDIVVRANAVTESVTVTVSI